MKLIIQIPCWNEESTLPATLATIPRQVAGVDQVEVLIVDDGSRDGTVAVARAHGADHIVRHTTNQGLAAAFQTGLDACLRLGADIIVNTDADNQYPQDRIPDLIAPILRGEADMVIGDRQVRRIEHFSPPKKVLQGWGSWVVRQVSGTSVPDAPSGFRAFSREAALRINVITNYTYTLETIIQAGKKNLAVGHVPITTNPITRKSRLIRSIPDYIKKNAVTIVRLYSLYEPLKVFFYIGLILLLIALFGGGRLIWFWFTLEGQNWRQTFERHTPTTIATVIALVFGFQIWLIGLIADLIASSRRLIEETLYRVKKLELNMDALEERGRTLAETLAPHPDGADSPNGSGPPAPVNGSAPAPTPVGLAAEQDRATLGGPGDRSPPEPAR
jgi:glycosyltransferase involved in cell wall biosynthesis